MAEELTRSLMTLAERGVPRGAGAVLADAGDDAVRHPAPPVAQQPAWAATIAFGATMAVLGGSLLFGLAMRHPKSEVGSSWFPETIGGVASTASDWWLLALAIAVALAAVGALIVRNQQHRTRKESTMTTTIERPTEQVETTERNNRWLVITVVMLALALLALGAWVIFDQASQPETAATAEVEALYDDYIAAWEDSDTSAFTILATDDYVFTSFGTPFSRDEQVMTIVALWRNPVFELVGDLVVMGAGPEYFVTAAERITIGSAEYFGVSAYRMVDTEDGLKIAEHNWVGNV